MTNAFDEFRCLLVAEGWYAVNSAVFRSGRYELVFDTSSYVEVYVAGTRIAETAVTSLDGFKRFLALRDQEWAS